jgi:hypothetical protein
MESIKDNHYVEIVETKTNKVEKRMGPYSINKAEKVQSGAEINLNFESYHTRITASIP